ncbi:O-succinylbenzoate synthase [Gracilibacillus ureilyticus]|uniref:o-succinylbenzoate synthase n=1 Tax=Gracilibacillus ureilyticus TaxID=531814 RepID=A0A1H9SV56_9BACI|nr:o-succinylbenzoate synthase [Gracilibacillus ureilyticus]SER88816.1 O-succinylbenzoate synthase [Gracilibacillus ureilyticus]
MIQIKYLIFHRISMPLLQPFANSRHTVNEKDFYLIELIDQDGFKGYGETVAFDSPWYTEETTNTARSIIEHELVSYLAEPMDQPGTFMKRAETVRRHHMAKAAVEGALWDLFAKRENKPLYRAIGSDNNQVKVGVAIGRKQNISILLQAIQTAVDNGYRRIKLKINRDEDLAVLDAVRSKYPDVPLMVDANSAYTIDDLAHIKKFDQYNLMMIEQPFAYDDFVDHAKLVQAINTPICLDESIHSFADARTAIALNSCQIMSIKLGRVGGFSQALAIHQLCERHHIPVWSGGMLEAGVGRAQSLALATLPNFSLPADQAGSDRYWKRDIITPAITASNGIITLPDKPGIGYEIDEEALQFYRTERKSIPVI